MPPVMPSPIIAGGVKHITFASGICADKPCTRARMESRLSSSDFLSDQSSSSIISIAVFSPSPLIIPLPFTTMQFLTPSIALTSSENFSEVFMVLESVAPGDSSMSHIIVPLSSRGINEEFKNPNKKYARPTTKTKIAAVKRFFPAIAETILT